MRREILRRDREKEEDRWKEEEKETRIREREREREREKLEWRRERTGIDLVVGSAGGGAGTQVLLFVYRLSV